MTDGRMLRPFHERFDIEVGTEEARQRFINRVDLLIFQDMTEGTLQKDLASKRIAVHDVTKYVALIFGEPLGNSFNPMAFVRGDFRRCLQVLEVVYKVLYTAGLGAVLSEQINFAINASEVDLEVRWRPPEFVRTGSLLLDEHLVNEPLLWLSEPRYRTVHDPFARGMEHYVQHRLADVITDMYVAVEAMAKIVTGRPNKDLSANTEMFISKLKVSNHYKTLLKDYIAYGNEYRHAEVEAKPRPPLSEPEVESFIYLTGLFIRLAIRTT